MSKPSAELPLAWPHFLALIRFLSQVFGQKSWGAGMTPPNTQHPTASKYGIFGSQPLVTRSFSLAHPQGLLCSPFSLWRYFLCQIVIQPMTLHLKIKFVGTVSSFLYHTGLLLAERELQVVRIENARNFHHHGCQQGTFGLIKIKQPSWKSLKNVLSGGEPMKFYTAYYGLQTVDCDKASFVYRKQPLPFSLWRT